jgi:hypothetical protein
MPTPRVGLGVVVVHGKIYASVSDLSFNETSKVATLNVNASNPTVTLYWIEISGREILLLPYIVTIGLAVVWFFIAQRKIRDARC